MGTDKLGNAADAAATAGAPDEREGANDWGYRLYTDAEMLVIREKHREMQRRAKEAVERAGIKVDPRIAGKVAQRAAANGGVAPDPVAKE